MPERLQKYLARAGVASRRQAELLITAGRISVNGQIVRKLGSTVSANDRVAVNGKVAKLTNELVYYALNKPKGVVTTSQDEQGRKTVLDLVPVQPRVVACGRLDLASQGLVILTNDGDLCYRVTHPSYKQSKVYQVTATINHGPPLEDRLNELAEGIALEEGTTQPAQISHVKRQGQTIRFQIILREGRNRQIRRMCSRVGLDVIDLIRTKIGRLTLGKLQPGRWRMVQKTDIFDD